MYESSRYHLDAADEFSEGLRRLSAGENNAAADAFSAAITLDPDHWSAYFRRAEAYGRLGLEEQANADLERAEFLMAAARQEMPKRMGFPDNAGTDFSASAGVSLGRVVGGIVGGVAGFVAGCVMGVLYFCAITGPAGAILGGIAGYRAGGGKIGCAGGCLAVIVGFLSLMLMLVILS